MKKPLFYGLMMLGYAWCVAVLLLGFAYTAVVWSQDGIMAMFRLVSPFNFRNWLIALAAIAPGIMLIVVGDRLWMRANNPDRE